MRVPFVDLKKQNLYVRKEIDIAIKKIVDSAIFVGGEEINKFEKIFSKKIGSKHAIAVGNGTDALFLALKTLGIGLGDEVITAANSFIATSEAITATGARVVFADIQPDTYNISPKEIVKKISANTKAIVPVHLYGQIAEMDSIMEIAKSYKLFVVEDAAQAHFSQYKTNKGVWSTAGTLGHLAAFSFYPGKNLGAFGDAGIVTTSIDEYATTIRMLSNHGRLSKFNHEIEGFNSRMDSLQAAILNVKIKYIEKWNERRKEIAAYYISELNTVKEIILPLHSSNHRPVWHLFVILADNRDNLKAFLKQEGIETGVHYPVALPNLKAYQYLKQSSLDFPVASSFQDKLLSLPMFPEMTFEQTKFVCDCIKKFYKK